MSPSPYSRKIGRLQLTAVLGDITEQETDAVVNAANNHLWMGSGVAGAIKAKGGGVIERQAMQLGPIEPGQAVTTSAGSLKARYCIHAAAMGQDLATSANLISKATRSSLSEAARLGIDSIAFPALGTGVGGFPADACARLMVAAALSHGRTNLKPSSVTFVLRDEPALGNFSEALGSIPEPNA
ncbi:Appr-1-p processing protein [candidate division WOR-3 bacterium]|uniref:Appr-1-p processing protein n=1 Tax=candidate division WOR-3 bacterium TaxID=2052148 RepID=A0A938BS34_UNCW3|nr:Appr-1-p processing protein [candidate division WOR-3 bacterium]